MQATSFLLWVNLSKCGPFADSRCVMPKGMDSVNEAVARSRKSAQWLSRVPGPAKDNALRAMARALVKRTPAILSANQRDVAEAREKGSDAAFLDRLLLTAGRIQAMADALFQVAALRDPLGEVVDSWVRPNGLKVDKVRIPLGVILMIYESRPNVTSDAAGLCLKSGNAVILKGGRESLGTNREVMLALHAGLEAEGFPKECVTLVEDTSRESLQTWLQQEGKIDLCIPRGGEGLIRFVAENARIPVVKHYKGVCHVYVHKEARLDMAHNIVLNAKTSRPGVCNAAECLLVDEAIAAQFLPSVGQALVKAGVELRGCPTTVALLRRAEIPVVPASPEDFGREFLKLILAVRVVPHLEAAMAHIEQFGSEHTEALITENHEVARQFTRQVTASAVLVNTSTRFNDGGELGLGAEIGISTSRLHAFGPMGLRELTSAKYVLHGSGQVR